MPADSRPQQEIDEILRFVLSAEREVPAGVHRAGNARGAGLQPLKTRDLITTVTVWVCSCSRLMSM